MGKKYEEPEWWKECKQMEDRLTKKEVNKILKEDRQDVSKIDTDSIIILMKGTKEEIKTLVFMIEIDDHIDNYIYDCLISLKKLRGWKCNNCGVYNE